MAEPAGSERGFVEGRDRRAARRHKADRPAIGICRRLAVGRLQHEEFRRRFAPGRTAVAEITDALVAERPEHAVIECARFCDVVCADCDMGEYRHAFLLQWLFAACQRASSSCGFEIAGSMIS